MAGSDLLKVEVAYALPDRQWVLPMQVEPGTTLREAVERSGLLDRFSEIDLDAAQLGVFGKLRAPSEAVRNGDRVEVYRPLIADPKDVRRRRAAKGNG